MMNKLTVIGVFLICLSGAGQATPTTAVWNPSTDIQATGVWHLGIDNYFTLKGPSNGGYAFPTDIGITYGVFPGLEVGLDAFFPQDDTVVFNAKYAIGETEAMPSIAFGGFGFGTKPGATDQNVFYGVMAKTFSFGRITGGYFTGNEVLLVDPSASRDNSGIILTWEKSVSDRLWLCVDYAGTRSALGACFYGFSWLFAPNVSVIFGYGTFNKGGEPTVSTQLDINL